MAIKLYNTLTKKKEAFKPLRGKVVRIYTCGPTVYHYAHIGNFRAYIFADILRRYMEYRGFDVKHAMNITDVGHMTLDAEADSNGEDKMEKAAKNEGKSPWEIADYYTKAFLQDSKTLNLKEPEVRPRATDHIKEMQDIIKRLIEKGYAYESRGNVYFEVRKFNGFGKLSGNILEELEAGKRIGIRKDKKSPEDFALWKSDPKHIMNWKSPWSDKGYPGWHIECSAMSMKYFGESFDIHTGGEDNIFPHHECEIAQSEAFSGKRFVKMWLHTRHLLFDGEKMSKSKGNFYTLRDILDKGYDHMAIRYALLSAHYRHPLDFSLKSIKSADQAIQKLRDFLYRLEEANGEGFDPTDIIRRTKESFITSMDDDLGISDGLSYVFDFIKTINKKLDENSISKPSSIKIQSFIYDLDKILGLNLGTSWNLYDKSGLDKLYRKVFGKEPKEKADKLIEDIIEKRDELRRAKKFKEADNVRSELKGIGITIEDLDGKTKWRIAR